MLHFTITKAQFPSRVRLKVAHSQCIRWKFRWVWLWSVTRLWHRRQSSFRVFPPLEILSLTLHCANAHFVIMNTTFKIPPSKFKVQQRTATWSHTTSLTKNEIPQVTEVLSWKSKSGCNNCRSSETWSDVCNSTPTSCKFECFVYMQTLLLSTYVCYRNDLSDYTRHATHNENTLERLQNK